MNQKPRSFSLLLGVLALLVAPLAPAGIVVTLDSVTPGTGTFSGYYIWSYSAAAPSTDSLFGAYFTIYDWDADIYTVEAAPLWSASAQLLGDTPSGQTPADDPTLKNVTFRFTRNQPGDDYSGFRIISTVGTSGPGGYAWYDWDTYPTSAGHDRSGVGETRIARSTTTVPEPGTLALLGVGIVGLGAIRRRKA